MPVIVPARLAFAGDGTPISETYGDVYHSADGGLEQARHVFLGGNGLPGRWRGRDRFVLLETGFGLGLNFLATWQAWRDDPERCARLHFISVEKHPFARDDLATLHRRWPELAPLADSLQRAWPPLLSGIHRLHLDAGRVTLTLVLGDAETALPRIDAVADAIYLDGFAPAKNPDLWSPAVLGAVTPLAAPGATLATWSVAGGVREPLARAGWQLEMRAGFGRKREMLCGRRDTRDVAPSLDRRALVIGAGIAGASAAFRLAARGWQVQLIERRAGPAMEASGNPAGVMLPLLAKGESPAARLSRACFLYGLRTLRGLDDAAMRWSPCGVVQIARDAAHEAAQREAIASLGLPPEFAAFRSREELAALLGRDVTLGGWHFPAGGWISPPTVCRALIASAGSRVETHMDTEVAALEPAAGGWLARDAAGRPLAEAPHVVLANADAARRLVPGAELPLTPVRGQVSYLAGAVLAELPMVVCRQGYVTPPAPVGPGGRLMSCLGASFDPGDADPEPRLSDDVANLGRLEALLPGASRGVDPARLGGRVGFRSTTPDRLPMIGTLPAGPTPAGTSLESLERRPGLHCLLGYGARGMVWANLAAELLAAQLEGEPLPLETDLVAAVDPARFLLRRQRSPRR